MSPSTRFSPLSLVFILSALIVPQIAAFTQCYYPDGSIPVDYIWEPCFGTTHSSCCIPTEGDVCQENGLCYYPGTNNTFRGACTDRTWNDPACPKDICVGGNEDTWAWSSPCSGKGSNDVSFACGHVEDKVKVTANCTAGATTNYNWFRTKEVSTSKATRYTSPPPVDTAKFTVYTVTNTAVISAWVQDKTFTTTWQSTITSALSQVSGDPTASPGGSSGTGTRAGITNGPSSTSSSLPANSSSASSSGITLTPGVLAAAIAGPIVGIALLAGLFIFLRKKRNAKKDSSGATRLGSSPSQPPLPPSNGPVGADQVHPYEAPANEAAGSFAPDRKYLYNPPPQDQQTNGGTYYEMSSAGEKGWAGYNNGSQQQQQTHNNGYNHHVAEVSGDATSPGAISRTGTPLSGGPRSPAPVYSESGHGPVIMPVELDGGDYHSSSRPVQNLQPGQQPMQRPVGSNRVGVGNA